ncbi:MAG: SH3 domain-containing protein [Clostridiales bacterium]|nr:SH3 domain-containing protein [Clostridiales bacterium]
MKWRRALAAALSMVLLLAMAPSLGAEVYPFIGYTTDSLRLRDKPSGTAEVLLVIPKGESLAVTGADGSYYIVEYNGQPGFAVQSFITRTAPGASSATAAATPLPANAEQAAKYPPLASGSTGPQVKALQQALQELNFYKGAIDSKYGDNTAKAVGAYQEKNKLPNTGMADTRSQELMFEGRPRNAAGRATQVRTLPAVDGLVLRPGDRGDAIISLQQRLKDQGYYKGALDGVYGRGTEQAVRAFQKASGLRQDGKAGANTMAKLMAQPGTGDAAVQATQAPVVPTATQAPVFQPEPLGEATYPYQTTASASVNMRKKASTSAARMLTIPANATITVLETSGDFLKVTYREYTGYAMSDYINVPEQYLAGKSLPIDLGARQSYEVLSVNATGDKVRTLQLALTELGYYKGTADGAFGASTLAAVKAFQDKNKLRATGVALPELQQLIYEKRPRNAAGRLVYLKLLPPIPGYPMQQGDMGDAVQVLNRALEQLGHLKSAYTNEYTAKTAAAVRDFQKAHSIRQTGKVDEFTLLAINTAAGITPQPTPQPADPQPQPVTPPAAGYVLLQKGTQGVAVTNLQARLVALGYYQVMPDGIYADKDVAAVKAFQIRNSLRVTGNADQETQQVLFGANALSADPASLQPTGLPTQETLRIGSVGASVIALQSRLIQLNYLAGNADGIFGTQTAKAVTSYQRKSGLQPDGVAGVQTLTSLYGTTAPGNPGGSLGATASAEEDKAAASSTLRIGDSGAPVKAMQQRLIELKYLIGGADGIFGPKTFLALQSFQSNNKLQSDGVAGSLTLAKLADTRALAAGGAAPLPTPTPAPVQPASPVFTAPLASEVRLGDWYTEVRSRLRSMPKVIVYDFMSGAHYNINVFSVGKHADGEPPTKQDTQIMEKALGYNNWDPRPVWVIFSDGRVYMGSTHSHGHEVDHNANNGLTGHICIHFPRDMADAEATGPYAVAHQNAILAGWDLTKSMAR